MKAIKMHEVNIKYINKIDSPYKRIIKHIVAPWTMGSENLWVGLTIIDPGNTSNIHSHQNQEEVFVVLSGRGKIMVNNEVANVEPGSVVFVPKGQVHQLINTDGEETLKVLPITSPPFIPDQFKKDHHIK